MAGFGAAARRNGRRTLVAALAVGAGILGVVLVPGTPGDAGAGAGNPTAGGPQRERFAAARRPPRFRFVFNSQSAPAAAAARGWNLIDVGSQWDADRLPRAAKALVWVGDYDNSRCAWQASDEALTSKIRAMAGDPKVVGYFFSDEPNPFACPAAPAQHRARSRLIHALDPGKITVLVSDSNSGKASLDQIPLWVGAADYVGLNPYVCYRRNPCQFGWIDTIIKAADRAGLRYWGVVQAFADDEWRWPTPAEEQRMLARWARSRQSGYMTFAWTWAGNSLSGRPGLMRVLERFNKTGRTGGAVPKRTRTALSASQIHYTFMSRSSVAFDWAGSARTIRFGRTTRYGRRVVARRAKPSPISSSDAYWEARLAGLKPGATYHYSIGGGRDATFRAPPSRSFRFDVVADVGDSASFAAVAATQAQIAADKPAFVLVSGDLTYGNDNGQAAVTRHFADVMVWSRRAAYMPAWGNHEWDTADDDLRNYKGRFAIPHADASPGAPARACCGEDWGWFDAGPVRFISYPEPYSAATWPAWRSDAGRIFAAAQADRRIRFIVTFGHRPAYSTGYHSGEPALAAILDAFGDRYSKYVLNFNGHSHNYERYRPMHGVVHITAAGGGAPLEAPWRRSDARTAYRAMHLEHVRVDATPTRLRVQAVCGASTSADDIACRAGQVIDSVTIAARS